MKKKHIMIFAGEKSGENHSFFLINALKKLEPQLIISGIGSGKMLETDFKQIDSITHLNAFQLGFIKRILVRPKLNRIIKKIENFIIENTPKIFIFIGIADDTQYFVIKLIKLAKKYNITTFYYFSPHVWLWSLRKTKKISNEVDYIFTFFEREDNAYKKFNAKTIRISHPILDELIKPLDYESFIKKYNISKSQKIISLIYGSRKKEIKLHTKLLFKIMKQLSKERNDLFFISAIMKDKINKKYFKKFNNYSNHRFIYNEEDYYNLIGNTYLSITCSGTASLEVSLYEKIQIVYYNLNWLDYLIWRIVAFISRINNLKIAMPNIILNEDIIPEFIQHNAKYKNISNEVKKLLENNDYQKNKIKQLKSKLGNGNGILKAAEIILTKYKN